MGKAPTIVLSRSAQKRWQSIKVVAIRKLDMVNAAAVLTDLQVSPGNRLEALSGNRKAQRSIRINDQYRICFVWKPGGAHGAEIVDYH
jgi:proteic killer suppression protein